MTNTYASHKNQQKYQYLWFIIARRYVAPESGYIHLPYQRQLPLLQQQPVQRYQGSVKTLRYDDWE